MKDNRTSTASNLLQNLIIGITISFVALSLGAALGTLSGRGAYAGIISAGVIAIITSLLGGTRVQCSGPTAPMSALSAIVILYSINSLSAEVNSAHFVNIVFLMCGGIVCVMGILRLGKYIRCVPNVVVSGFMNGIAILIWLGQIRVLSNTVASQLLNNLLLVAATLLIVFLLPILLKNLLGKKGAFIPSTLVAIIFTSFITYFLDLNVEKISIAHSIGGIEGFLSFVNSQVPTDWSQEILMAAFPFALQLASLCYLDTLLTSLVVDKMKGEKTRQNKELIAQGIANSSIAILGGIPGAQATIRSVLMIKEGATSRLAGIMVGVFVLIEMIVFQPLMSNIPLAVFVGILIKVGCDVFDFKPLIIYLKESFSNKKKFDKYIPQEYCNESIAVTHAEILFIACTTAVTVLVDLNAAVIIFSILFHVVNKVIPPEKRFKDLNPTVTTASYNEDRTV